LGGNSVKTGKMKQQAQYDEKNWEAMLNISLSTFLEFRALTVNPDFSRGLKVDRQVTKSRRDLNFFLPRKKDNFFRKRRSFAPILGS